uniref:Uncharacterized protein n=1 Tax=Vibrio splendidus TaxID=29497 RepID=A0A0H3ZKG5_VIBSP|nr:hypothetical protein [Vibrio splendidus]
MAERPLLHIEKQFGIQQIKKNPLWRAGCSEIGSHKLHK